MKLHPNRGISASDMQHIKVYTTALQAFAMTVLAGCLASIFTHYNRVFGAIADIAVMNNG
ncbi:MAG: hypothetical protein HC910_01000 [Spirulinaceae cyanobacterium SM2_1_0]|nr:hypothetical protein [Spirulinaceae cyanobacterium SM2_1_0]